MEEQGGRADSAGTGLRWQTEAAAPSKQPEPPPDAQRFMNKPWSPRGVLTDRSHAQPPSVVLTKATLQHLFGWQHGSCKDICPTVVFRCTPPGGGAATELEPVQLLPPSRDDRDVQEKKREGGKRGRTDGYPVPRTAVKQLLAQLFGGASPAGRKLHFRSAGWRGSQLVLDVSHEAADLEPQEPVDVMEDSLPFHAPYDNTDTEAPVEQGTVPHAPSGVGSLQAADEQASAAATAWASAAAAERAAEAAALAAEDECAGAGAACVGDASAPGDSNGAGLAQPLMACLDSLQPAAKSIVQAAHSGWLPTDQVYRLMSEHAALGVPMTTQQPIRPTAGDLYLADYTRRFDRGDGHDWVDRRSNKLKVDGVEAFQVVYFTTRDGQLQRRAYHFLAGCKPELAGLHLLHYHTTDWMQAKFRPKRRRDNEEEPEWQPLLQTAQASPAGKQQQLDGEPAEAAPIYSLRGAGGPTELVTKAARASIIPPAAPPADADPYRWSTTRWSRAERIWSECGAIARDLLNNETRDVIGNPVDPAKVAKAGVERPMDLGTVLRKLAYASGGYSTPYKFRDDVRLAFTNCRLIYPEGSRERTIAEAASARFEAEWAAAFVEERWEAHQRLCEEEEHEQQLVQQA